MFMRMPFSAKGSDENIGEKRMDIYQFFKESKIEYQRQDHPAVFTCEEATKLVPHLPGAKTKNLFVCDAKGRSHFLVVVGYEKTVDLKGLAPRLAVKKLRFASPNRLKKYLGIDPGSVSILAVINDQGTDVQVVFDRKLWGAKAFQCHPLINTSTLVISHGDIERFLDLTGHKPRVIDVPARK